MRKLLTEIENSPLRDVGAFRVPRNVETGSSGYSYDARRWSRRQWMTNSCDTCRPIGGGIIGVISVICADHEFI
jgi:hypothetical protein